MLALMLLRHIGSCLLVVMIVVGVRAATVFIYILAERRVVCVAGRAMSIHRAIMRVS